MQKDVRKDEVSHKQMLVSVCRYKKKHTFYSISSSDIWRVCWKARRGNLQLLHTPLQHIIVLTAHTSNWELPNILSLTSSQTMLMKYMPVAKQQILDHKRRWDVMGYGKKRTIILIDLAKTELRKAFHRIPSMCFLWFLFLVLLNQGKLQKIHTNVHSK